MEGGLDVTDEETSGGYAVVVGGRAGEGKNVCGGSNHDWFR